MRALLAPARRRADKDVDHRYSGYVTSIFLIGWGTGGLVFGILGDLIGRAKTMMLTILLYSLFTGLSALSTGFWDFAFYRFLTGLGVGGEFAVGVSLVAEVMPDRARPFALGCSRRCRRSATSPRPSSASSWPSWRGPTSSNESWRVMFVVGTVPALLAAFVILRLKEPERWRQVRCRRTPCASGCGSYFGELFSDPRWTRNALVGLLPGPSGIIGLWGIGFFSIDLQQAIFRRALRKAEGLSRRRDVDVQRRRLGRLHLGDAQRRGLLRHLRLQLTSRTTSAAGRPSPSPSCWPWSAPPSSSGSSRAIGDIFWMIPIMGFCQLALFGGYAIYFPSCSRRGCAARARRSATTSPASSRGRRPDRRSAC